MQSNILVKCCYKIPYIPAVESLTDFDIGVLEFKMSYFVEQFNKFQKANYLFSHT
jgi:hypothetical protein